MGATAREEGVLKLVHPGRHVETHLEPISAAEVMRRNPRHSVARPDVFEFPFVVVRPESMLLPGKVFLIVPNHTIYKLTKEYESRKNLERSKSKSTAALEEPVQPGKAIVLHQPAKEKATAGERDSGQRVKNSQGIEEPVQPGKAIVLHQPAKEKATAGERDSGQRVKNSQGIEKPAQPVKAIVLHQPVKQKLTAVDQSRGLEKKNPVQASCWYPATASPGDRDLDKRVKRQSQVGCWPEAISRERNHRTARNGDNSTASVIYGDERSKICKNQVAGLKSCLRQHGCARERAHRVSFVLPNKDE